jgi:hypothetical protein
MSQPTATQAPTAGWLIDATGAGGPRFILSDPKAPFMLTPWGSVKRLDANQMANLVAAGVAVDPPEYA